MSVANFKNNATVAYVCHKFKKKTQSRFSAVYVRNVKYSTNWTYLLQYVFFVLFFIKTYLTRMTHQPEAVLHEVLPYTTTQLIYMTTKHQHKT